MKKHESSKPFFGAAMFCAAVCALVVTPLAHAQTTSPTPTNPAGAQTPAPATPPVKGDTTLLTTDAQVTMPASMVLRGALKADKKVLKVGEPVTFTYSVTNTGKTDPQTLQFSTGQRFDVLVQAKNGLAPVWQMGRERMFTMALGILTFAPGETKTFTATWKPAPGEIKPGASYTVMAHLTPTAKSKPSTGSPQTAHATLSLTAAK